MSLYLRHVERVASEGKPTISSRALGNALDFTDAQVRKDLAYFGHLGHPGVGYRVSELIPRLKKVLGTDRSWPVALVGAGNLGRALVSHPGFVARGFALTTIFDAISAGETVEAIVVQPMEALTEVIRRDGIRLAILAVPAEAAQAVADQLIEAGVHGILNFAPVMLDVPEHVTVNAVDLAGQLEQLAFAVHDADSVR